jgi:hypothetical protein
MYMKPNATTAEVIRHDGDKRANNSRGESVESIAVYEAS